jgi:hypothetical protein
VDHFGLQKKKRTGNSDLNGYLPLESAESDSATSGSFRYRDLSIDKTSSARDRDFFPKILHCLKRERFSCGDLAQSQ